MGSERKVLWLAAGFVCGASWDALYQAPGLKRDFKYRDRLRLFTTVPLSLLI